MGVCSNAMKKNGSSQISITIQATCLCQDTWRPYSYSLQSTKTKNRLLSCHRRSPQRRSSSISCRAKTIGKIKKAPAKTIWRGLIEQSNAPLNYRRSTTVIASSIKFLHSPYFVWLMENFRKYSLPE